jgi:hypothetical protein
MAYMGAAQVVNKGASAPTPADRIRTAFSPENIAAVQTALAPFGVVAPPPPPPPPPSMLTTQNVIIGLAIIAAVGYVLKKAR